MPHKCVRCGIMYGSGSEELFKGCSCGSRIFMFIKPELITLKEQMEIMERESQGAIAENKEALEEISEITPISIEKAPASAQQAVQIDLGAMNRPLLSNVGELEKLAKKEREKIELMQEASEILEQKQPGAPASLEEKGVENITILEKGRYLLDINSLMSGNPLVIRSEHGVFYIRIPAPIMKKAKN
ncbi:MAG TPA: Zn-ribbon containing protein [Candidatus Norongarragalinales archaeon]|nr:Zn-ribbon containing protein [Candidatus Norongarragalinales archaeon]